MKFFECNAIRRYAKSRVRYSRRAAPLTVLDAYLVEYGLTNEAFAEMVRKMRCHPAGPTHVTVSNWRTGKAVPGHDVRMLIDVLTKGEIGYGDWDG